MKNCPDLILTFSVLFDLNGSPFHSLLTLHYFSELIGDVLEMIWLGFSISFDIFATED